MIYTSLSHLTDAELLRHVENERDPLTSTDAEVELVERFNALLEDPPLPEDLQKALDDTGIEVVDLAELVTILEEFYAGDAKTLREKLKCANDFYDIASDAGDAIERLNTLVSSTL